MTDSKLAAAIASLQQPEKEQVARAIANGISPEDIIDAHDKGLSLLKYISARGIDGSVVISHDNAVEALQAGVEDYSFLVGFYRLSHDDVLRYRKEFTSQTALFAEYCIARKDGAQPTSVRINRIVDLEWQP